MNLTPSSSSGGMSLNPTVTLLQAKDVNVYYPYGTHFSDVFATTDRYQYSGKELDRMNGLDLYDFHARQYDPALGRFTTPDPINRLTDYNGVMSIYITITKRKTNRYCKD